MSTRRFSFCVTSFALTSLALAAGCASKSTTGGDVDAQDQADVSEASSSNAQSSHFAQLFVSNVSSSDPSQAASDNAMTKQFWPAGCATRAKDATNPLVVHVTLNDCTGPFGLVHVSGQLTATFSQGPSGLHVDVASTDLTANGRPVTESGSGDISVSGTTRTTKWQGAWTRVNAAGETVSHTTDATIVYDASAGCRTTDGTAQTNVGAREIDSTINGYKICTNASGTEGCPSGEIIHTSKRTGASIKIEFDGSASAQITGPKGHTVDVPLVCVP
jgi:hypothetical protein